VNWTINISALTTQANFSTTAVDSAEHGKLNQNWMDVFAPYTDTGPAGAS